MAEALATISLVGNIMQFIAVGVKVASSIREIYKKGSLGSNSEVASTAGRLKGALDLLRNGPLEKTDAKLAEMMVECSKLADELTTILNGLKPDRRKIQLLEATSKSLKSVKVHGRIKNIERKLEKMQDAVSFRLNVILSTDQAALLPSLRDNNELTKMFYRETCDRLDNMTADLKKTLTSRDLGHSTVVNFFEVARKLSKLVDEAKDSDKICKILGSLYFMQMKERQSDVAQAHRTTFEWIFKQKTDVNFMDWLQHSNGIYWISGKAGSGKSTLMKFILHHPCTKELLARWAKRQDPVIADHFFWSAGTGLQKSQEGLFITLLSQIFAQCPEIVSQACPTRWSLGSFACAAAWTRAELFHTFETISAIPSLPQRICLFIDGLDEYRGDHAELVEMLRIISRSADIKICASSRPWQVFQDAFEASKWKLYVHDLTKEDIRVYVQDKLGGNSRFQLLEQRNPQEAAFLVRNIQTKAQGVFLWVYLVVRSLLRGLLNRDEISDLRRRLNDLPGELEKYFKLMLDTIEPIYQEQSARVFKIMGCAGATLPVVMFHFVDQERKDSDYVLLQETQPFSAVEIADMVDEKKRQLNARCRDLLHFTVSSEEPEISRQRVGFLHRTVVDFLQTEEMDSLLSSRCNSEFNPDSSLCKAYLAILKASSVQYQGNEISNRTSLSTMVMGSMFYAKEASERSEKTNYKVLDCLEQVVTHITERCNQKPQDLVLLPKSNIESFLDLAVRLGLSRYIQEKMSKTPSHDTEPSLVANAKLGNLLTQALQDRFVIEKEFDFSVVADNEIDLSMVQLLLNCGADPTCKPKAARNDTLHFHDQISSPTAQNDSDRSVWANFLFQIQANYTLSRGANAWDMTQHLDRSAAPDRIPVNLFEACQLMIEHGAPRKYHNIDDLRSSDRQIDLPARRRTSASQYNKFLDAENVFEEVFSDSEAASLARLLRRFGRGEYEEQVQKRHCTIM
ncbi:MAG: hypothetical protein M1822_007233 [Bathelium mastoideum]|nr:MAG: hypothetical protein M1822_007233 [Bathelium mastoideum]